MTDLERSEKPTSITTNTKKRKKMMDQPEKAEEDPVDNVDYILKEGKRHIIPYIYSFRTRAKGRWYGRSILQVFEAEFRTYSSTYYAESIRAGTIQVNGVKVDPSYIIRNGDLIVHQCHRHEPPVLGDPIPLITDNDDVIVVSKPCTIPIHPCGAYRHNCLISIMNHDRPDLGKLHLIYRLDRLTSGLTILAKSSEVASRLSEELRGGQTKKYYLAMVDNFQHSAIRQQQAVHAGDVKEGSNRAAGAQEILFDAWCCDEAMVRGEEDEEENNGKNGGGKRRKKDRQQLSQQDVAATTSRAPMHWVVQSDGSTKIEAGIRCVSNRDGIYEVHPEGKPSTTIIRVRGVDDEGRALLECRPVTGRTHQIRLHLQWLGFPIVNDPNYGPPSSVAAFREKWNKEEETATNIIAEASKNETTTVAIEGAEETVDERIRRLCPYCILGDGCFKDIQLHHKGIYLHALRYQGRDWRYETPLPGWAKGFRSEEARQQETNR